MMSSISVSQFVLSDDCSYVCVYKSTALIQSFVWIMKILIRLLYVLQLLVKHNLIPGFLL